MDTKRIDNPGALRFALTQPYTCNYLPNNKEQLLVFMPPAKGMEKKYYHWLITEGFRRSGEQVYRPHCQGCQACKSVRIDVQRFAPSKSQKRLLKRIADWQFNLADTITPHYYSVYERYIRERHADGTMYPPSKSQFLQFAQCQWNPPKYLEAWDGERFVGAAVTDVFEDAFSALYSFFDPDYSPFSPGKAFILKQIGQAKAQGKNYLYLGYQVDACRKMSYKDQFYPQQQFIGGKWVDIEQKG